MPNFISSAKKIIDKYQLKDLTNLFLNVAETEAKEQKTITMNGWIEVADDLLKYRKKNILKDAGAHIISLGRRILRTETVALQVASIIMYELGL